MLHALTLSNGSTQAASLMLIGSLRPSTRAAMEAPPEVEEDEVEEARFDERTALESIFGDDHFQEIWFDIGKIVGCEVRLEDVGASVLVRYDAPSVYPHEATGYRSLLLI